jgi:predicted HTH transcriptional regulator
LIENNPKITQIQLKDELDLSIATVKRMMAELQIKKNIKRKGSSRREEWIIISTKE